jgi:hypothetical protein
MQYKLFTLHHQLSVTNTDVEKSQLSAPSPTRCMVLHNFAARNTLQRASLNKVSHYNFYP